MIRTNFPAFIEKQVSEEILQTFTARDIFLLDFLLPSPVTVTPVFPALRQMEYLPSPGHAR